MRLGLDVRADVVLQPIMTQGVDMWICPDCGTEVEVGARGCPRCLEQHRRGRQARRQARRSWERDSIYDGLDLPGEDGFDYDEFVAREFGRRPHRRIGIAWYWWLTGLVLLIAVVAVLVIGLR